MARESHYHLGTPPEERPDWNQHTRIDLTPISAPAVLGLFAFGGAMWPVSAHMGGWYGGAHSYNYLWEFSGLFGGVGELIAAVWSYRARNALGTALFGLWGCWWLAWGLMTALTATGALAPPAGDVFQEFGFWFITTGIVTLFCMVAALRVNLGVFAMAFCAATGSLLGAAGFMGGNVGLQHAAGADLFVAGIFAVYAAAAIMLEELWGRPVLWLGETGLSRTPTMTPLYPIDYEHGVPGSRRG